MEGRDEGHLLHGSLDEDHLRENLSQGKTEPSVRLFSCTMLECFRWYWIQH